MLYIVNYTVKLEKDQAKNTTRTNYITLNGETLSISEWEKRTGIKRGTLYSRFYIYKWSEERTLTTPVQTRTKLEFAIDCKSGPAKLAGSSFLRRIK